MAWIFVEITLVRASHCNYCTAKNTGVNVLGNKPLMNLNENKVKMLFSVLGLVAYWLQTIQILLQIHYFSVGTRSRDRRIVRDSVRPHGQCLSDLKETANCIAEACFTFNFVNIAGKMECSRSDGVIVQGQTNLSSSL